MNIQIANPIYDIVFKYMMEDNDVAKLLLSSIMGCEVTYLEPRPQDYTTTKSSSGDIYVYRLDFAARIETAEGSKLVLIELQKATYMDDVMRFRRYLGKQYSKKGNVEIINVAGKDKKIPLPIYCLYFLGKDAGIEGVPVLEVNPVVRDVATGDVINQRSQFIESLHHRTWIVQIKYLKEPRRTELEQLLSIFDQSKYSTNVHILKIKEEDFPKKYHPLIRRLKMAASSVKIQKKMENEDLYLEQMIDTINDQTAELRITIAEKDNTIAEQAEAIAEKDNTIAEKEKENAEKDNALAEKDNALAEKDNALAEKDNIIARMQAEMERLLSSNKQ
jgi:uncharacterized coiled-coil protein SlyX